MEEREWFAGRYEELKQTELSADERVHLAKLMLKSQGWDHFLQNKFTAVKRYGGEGAEAAMCFYDELFRLSAKNGEIFCEYLQLKVYSKVLQSHY